MAYTNNVPQANDKIASTQPLILQNFQFLQTGIGTEHRFTTGGSGSDMVHLQASMPNQAANPALPGSTDGMYYVSSNLPRFKNAAGDNSIQLATLLQNTLNGTTVLNTSTSTVVAFPANSCGNYYLLPPAGIGAAAYAVGQFITSGGTAQIGTVSDPNLSVTTSGLNLRASTTSSTYNGTYKYVVVYYTP